MVAKPFLIFFEYRLPQSEIAINLGAEVESRDNPPCYIVRRISAAHLEGAPAIPEVRLMRKSSAWVHLDSQKSTDLTMCIGKAIDAFEHE